jgi:hypothetical protein
VPEAGQRTCRLITLIAIDGPAPVPFRALPAIDAAAEERLFGVPARAGWSEFDDSGWRPRFDAVRDWAPDDYGAPGVGSAYRVSACRTALVTVPLAGELLLLDLSVEADLAGMVVAERDAYDPAVRLTLRGEDILAAARDGEGTATTTDRRRQILVLEPGPGTVFGTDPAALSPAQERTLRQLMFKDTDVGFRAAMAPVEVPLDLNGPDQQSIFVWDTNTVAEGLTNYPFLAGIRLIGMVLSNCQVLGALQRCHDIRAAALRDVDAEPRGGSADPGGGSARSVEEYRTSLEQRLRRIGGLQRDLNLAVEMYALGAAVLGGRPLHRYHEAVVRGSPLPHLLAVTRHLLDQLLGGVKIDQELLDVQEARETAHQQLAIARSTQGLLDQSEAFKAASIVFAAIAVIISLAGLFTAAAAIPERQTETMLGSAPGSVIFVLAAAVSAALLGVGLHAASKITLTTRRQRLVRRVRWFLLTLLTAAIVVAPLWALASESGGLALATGAAVAGISSVLILLCVALELTFDAPLPP